MADSGAYRPAAELKAHLAWDPITLAIRETEQRYPTQAELEAEMGSDNIGRLATYMQQAGHLDAAELAELRKEVSAVVEDAVQFAAQSAQPSLADAWTHMHCNIRHEILI
jgi:pyruvate dehydrogenase E1 component alpha subunit